MSARKIFAGLDAAVAGIEDGATIGFAGFSGVGSPCFLVGALIRQGAKRLTCVANSTNPRDFPLGRADMGGVVSNGQLAKAICSFTAPTRPSQKLSFTEFYEAGGLRIYPRVEGRCARQSAIPTNTAKFQSCHGHGRGVTIVEVKEEILPAGGIDPDLVHVPAIYVHRLVKTDLKGMA